MPCHGGERVVFWHACGESRFFLISESFLDSIARIKFREKATRRIKDSTVLIRNTKQIPSFLPNNSNETRFFERSNEIESHEQIYSKNFRSVGVSSGLVFGADCLQKTVDKGRSIQTNGRHKECHRCVRRRPGFFRCVHRDGRDSQLPDRDKTLLQTMQRGCRAQLFSLQFLWPPDVKRSYPGRISPSRRFHVLPGSPCYAFTFCAAPGVEGNPVFAKILDLCPERYASRPVLFDEHALTAR